MDSRHALLGYRSTEELWTVRVDYNNAASPGLRLDYGVTLNERFAMGTNVNVAGRRQDLVVNTFFAPLKNLRLQVAGGQLIQRNDAGFLSGIESGLVQQNNFMVDLRKNWSGETVIRGLGLTAYGANAMDRSSVADGDRPDASGAVATGTLEGYRLNLTLAPTTLSRLELNHGIEQVAYAFADGTHSHELAESYEARYVRQLDQCAHIHGGVRTALNEDRFDIGVRKRAWNVGVSQTTRRSDDSSTIAVQIHYAIPLATDRNRPPPCASMIATAPKTGRIINQVAHRPQQLPSAALARIDTTAQRAE